ncbi:MAG: relaxase/mobilization nuclease domain-containing protein [Oscillospiraceae bacterium]|jgi:hypothetical protein|nr:relaxase/mobilization nuclease domain-containing protein [Oscillospiraceae bacterium]
MAVIKIHPIKSTLRAALDYICNPDKTDEKLLISSFGCVPETADIEFDFTLSNSVMNKGNNLAHHLIQSFAPGEVKYEHAHRIGEELAAAVLGGKYEYVLTTHIDKGHIHNHIMFCAASFVDRHKYVSNRGSMYGIRRESDRLCREHGLSVIIPGEKKRQSIGEKAAENEGRSWKSKLREALDRHIEQSGDWEDFLRRLESDGYTVKRAKYHSYKMPGQERFCGGQTLGAEYADERIKERIAGLTVAPKRKHIQLDDGRINLIIDIENSVKAQQSAGYAHWAKLHNLKEAAKTVAFLSENNILAYADLRGKIGEIQAMFDETAATLKGAEKRIADLSLLIKNIENFRRTYGAYKAHKQAKGSEKEQLARQHESALIIHNAARKALREMGIDGKLPDVAVLKKERDRLTADKARLYEQYSGLKKQAAEYGKIKANIDQILDMNEHDKSRDHTRQV